MALQRRVRGLQGGRRQWMYPCTDIHERHLMRTRRMAALLAAGGLAAGLGAGLALRRVPGRRTDPGAGL